MSESRRSSGYWSAYPADARGAHFAEGDFLLACHGSILATALGKFQGPEVAHRSWECGSLETHRDDQSPPWFTLAGLGHSVADEPFVHWLLHALLGGS